MGLILHQQRSGLFETGVTSALAIALIGLCWAKPLKASWTGLFRKQRVEISEPLVNKGEDRREQADLGRGAERIAPIAESVWWALRRFLATIEQ